MLKALFLARSVGTISEHGSRFIIAGKQTLSSFVTVEQVEFERTGTFLRGFAKKGNGGYLGRYCKIHASRTQFKHRS